MSTAIITADIELSNFPDEQGLWGRIGSETWGLPKLLAELREQSVPATMFVDVYGAAPDALDAQQKACELIMEHGQDLQLHTHPAPSFDPNREQMRHYSLDEQCQILEFGRERIRRWTGVEVRVHRAGDWAANEDTLRAMARLGFTADFSSSAWSRSCGIPGASEMGNGWTEVAGMMCAAGTCYRDRITGRIRRMDLGGVSMAEVRECIHGGVDPLILTPHSFSMMKFNGDRTKFAPDHRYVRHLRQYVSLARRSGYAFMPAGQAAEASRAKIAMGPTACPLPSSSFQASVRGIAKSAFQRALLYIF